MAGRRATLVAILGVILIACGAEAQPTPSERASPNPSLVESPRAAVTPSLTPAATSTPTPVAMPTPTSTPGPTLEPPWTNLVKTLAWHRLATIPADIIRLVGFSSGYVALLGGGDAIAYSSDGRKWKTVDLPLHPPISGSDRADGNGLIGRTLAANDQEVLIVGGYSHKPCPTHPPGDTGYGPECDYSPVTWVSADGVHWQDAYPDVGSLEFVAAWPVAAGGWDAAASEWYGESLGGQELWHSADGKKWARLKASPPAAWEGYNPDAPVGVASSADQYLLAASSRGLSFSTTLAGRSKGSPWTVLKAFPGTGAQVITGIAPTAPGTPWVLGGLTYDESRCNPEADGDLCGVMTPTVWSSTDLSHWRTSVLSVGSPAPATEPDEDPLGVTDVASMVLSDRGYVAVGAASAWWQGSRHETWVSDDGSSWITLPQPDRPAFDWGPGLVATGPAGVIGISATDSENESEVWALR